ncbi:PD-(D/E)XK nuclease family protein, partial [Streptomyces rhizosphaericus]|uniref:PD-(D/E)XK nuclease family protein n=3 Tax=Streptomyces TaxID=1883 RepID=UPI00117F4463
ARRTPYRVEVPVQLTLAGRTIRGRIDAVYRESGTGPDDGPRYEIVDWKTGRSQDADPLQLAIYRVAWAEQHGLPLSAVTAAFVYVRSGEVVRPAGLPGRAGLERVLLGEPGDADVGGDGDVDGDVAIGRDGDGDVGRDGDADIGWDGDADTTGNDRIDAGTVTESERT